MSENSAAKLVEQFKKSFGDGIAEFAPELKDCARLQSGLFAFDLASGGGFPRGRTSIIYGPESSGKTNLAMRVAAEFQKENPDQVVAFVDAEQAFSPVWAEKVGVNVEKLLLIKPDYAEQVVDIVEALLSSEDCGLVIVDSIGAMAKMSELDSTAEKAIVGGNSMAVGKMCRKAIHAQLAAEKEGRHPSLILLNQIRFKVGVLFGDPESMPGGEALKHNSAMTVRLYGKNIVDNSVSKTLPCRKLSKFIIKKWKAPIFATHGEFEMITVPHAGLQVGQADDLRTIVKYLKECEWMSKEGNKYMVNIPNADPLEFDKQGDAVNWVRSNRDSLVALLISHLTGEATDGTGEIVE